MREEHARDKHVTNRRVEKSGRAKRAPNRYALRIHADVPARVSSGSDREAHTLLR